MKACIYCDTEFDLEDGLERDHRNGRARLVCPDCGSYGLWAPSIDLAEEAWDNLPVQPGDGI